MSTVQALQGSIIEASMGPRGLARGCFRLRPKAMTPNGFNGAAGVGPRMTMVRARPPAIHKLQWGRGGWPADDAENQKWITRLNASMGPRGLARG